MSISEPRVQLERPTQKYIHFKNGQFSFWNKACQEEVVLELPLRFVILDELTTISGYHEPSESGIYSNEVHLTSKEELNVRSFKGGDIVKGLYSVIKDKVKASGGRYTRSVYAMMNGEIVNFQIAGAAFSSWIEASAENKTHTVSVSSLNEGKKGATKYKIPVFVFEKDKEEEVEEAKKLDKIVQDYLREYKKETKKELVTSDELDTMIEEAKSSPLYNNDNRISPSDLPF